MCTLLNKEVLIYFCKDKFVDANGSSSGFAKNYKSSYSAAGTSGSLIYTSIPFTGMYISVCTLQTNIVHTHTCIQICCCYMIAFIQTEPWNVLLCCKLYNA